MLFGSGITYEVVFRDLHSSYCFSEVVDASDVDAATHEALECVERGDSDYAFMGRMSDLEVVEVSRIY